MYSVLHQVQLLKEIIHVHDINQFYVPAISNFSSSHAFDILISRSIILASNDSSGFSSKQLLEQESLASSSTCICVTADVLLELSESVT